MAALGGALLSSVLQKSPAEKALSPWWDRVQDYITYGIIVISKLLFIPIDLKFNLISMNLPPFRFACTSINTSIGHIP